MINSRAIVIPTYENHFPYVFDLLTSMEQFVIDIDCFDICLILSSPEEEKLLKKYLSSKTKLNIKFYNIENILQKYNIDSENLLNIVGKYSYQTIKKLYGLHFLQYNQSYIMDSESLFIKKVSLNDLFDNYFSNPFVLMCSFSVYPPYENQNYLNFYTLKNVANMFNLENIDNFYFDGFNWFYDINIVNDLFDYFQGSLFNTIKNISITNKNSNPRSQAIFECILYYEFIYLNNNLYKYHFINTVPLIEAKIGKEKLSRALQNIRNNNKLYPIFMHSWEFLNVKDIENYSHIYKDLNFKIARLFVSQMPQEKVVSFIKNSDIRLIVSTDNLRKCILNIKTDDEDIVNVQNFLTQTNVYHNNYAIITPIFKDHFPFVKKYLKSFIKYVADKDKITLYFIISKNEKNDFETVIEPYKNKCNIKILFCEDLFKQYGIKLSADELLKKYGRFSFQTFKKLYAVLSIPEEKSLILDSESMWVQKTNMQQMFIDFFAKPRIYGSILEPKYRIGVNFNQMVKNVDYLLEENCPYWFLENYMWFYEKRIVQDLVKRHGTPIDMAEKLRLNNLNMKINENILSGIFEITLYQNFIYFNLQKYKYDFINIDDWLKKYLPSKDFNAYKSVFYKKFLGGCGLTEHVCLFLKKNNVKNLAKLFKDLHIRIFRCDKTDAKNYKLQKKFLNFTQPNILASSQNHCFGINNTLKSRLKIMVFSSKSAEKLKEHVQRFGMPIKKFVNWLLEPFSILFYLIKLLIHALRYIKIILLG